MGRPRTNVSAAKRAEVRCRYKAGATLDEVSAATGLSVWLVRRELGRTRRHPARKRHLFADDPSARAEIVSRYEAGESVNWLAEWFECSASPIKRVLLEEGVDVRGRDRCRGFTFRDRLGRVFFFRSSWEAKTAAWLDARRFNWDYEVEQFDDYLPDFWIYNSGGEIDYLIEVKGWLSPEGAEKIERFRERHSEIRLKLWRKAQLKRRGILDLRPETLVDHRFRTRMNRAVRKQIIKLYESGMSAIEVGREVGRAKSSVLRVLHIAGVVRGVSEAKLLNSSFAPSKRNKAEQLYRKGLSLNEVSEKIGVPLGTVYDELRKRGVVRRKACRGS